MRRERAASSVLVVRVPPIPGTAQAMTALAVGLVESDPLAVTVRADGPDGFPYVVDFVGLHVELSAAAAESLVDGLIEALVAGGDRHDPAPF